MILTVPREYLEHGLSIVINGRTEKENPETKTSLVQANIQITPLELMNAIDRGGLRDVLRLLLSKNEEAHAFMDDFVAKHGTVTTSRRMMLQEPGITEPPPRKPQ